MFGGHEVKNCLKASLWKHHCKRIIVKASLCKHHCESIIVKAKLGQYPRWTSQHLLSQRHLLTPTKGIWRWRCQLLLTSIVRFFQVRKIEVCCGRTHPSTTASMQRKRTRQLCMLRRHQCSASEQDNFVWTQNDLTECFINENYSRIMDQNPIWTTHQFVRCITPEYSRVHLWTGDFHAHISTGHHDAVALLQDLVIPSQALSVFCTFTQNKLCYHVIPNAIVKQW